jgi:hypothetical protein
MQTLHSYETFSVWRSSSMWRVPGCAVRPSVKLGQPMDPDSAGLNRSTGVAQWDRRPQAGGRTYSSASRRRQHRRPDPAGVAHSTEIWRYLRRFRAKVMVHPHGPSLFRDPAAQRLLCRIRFRRAASGAGPAPLSSQLVKLRSGSPGCSPSWLGISLSRSSVEMRRRAATLAILPVREPWRDGRAYWRD